MGHTSGSSRSIFRQICIHEEYVARQPSVNCPRHRTNGLERVTGSTGRGEYRLSDKGTALWPAVRALLAWGDEYYAPAGPLRVFQHAADEAPLDKLGRCTACGAAPAPRDTLVAPGSGLREPVSDDDVVTAALARPHLLLNPVRQRRRPRRYVRDRTRRRDSSPLAGQSVET
jgi:hypothetical protein